MKGHFGSLCAGVVLLLVEPVGAGLVLHLPLDAGSNSVPAGGASFGRGVVGDAVAFGPTSEALVVASGAAGLKLPGAVSMGCWFRADGAPNEEFVIVEAGGCRLGVSGGGGCGSFAARGVKGRLAGITAASKARGYSNVCDGKWHHLVGCYDGKSLSVWIDSVMEEIIDASGQIAARGQEIVIGKHSRAAGGPANTNTCWIDDIRICDEALDYESISGLASRQPPKVERVDARRLDLRRDFLDKGVFPIQVHRGGGLALPEHTLETYRETWARGMIPEADIRTTRDGAIICIHDNDLKRVSPATPAPWNAMPIEELTLERVKTFDVGAFRGRPGQKVPTLEEVFRDMQGRAERMLELDYKQIGLGELAALIKRYGVKDQVIFVTRYHHLIRRWQQIAPHSATMLWMGGSEHALGRMLEQLRRDDFAGISILQLILFKDATADGVRPPLSFLKRCQAEVGERGIVLQLIPWEISDPAVFERLLRAGFRYFGTDYPETAIEAYQRVAGPAAR